MQLYNIDFGRMTMIIIGAIGLFFIPVSLFYREGLMTYESLLMVVPIILLGSVLIGYLCELRKVKKSEKDLLGVIVKNFGILFGDGDFSLHKKLSITTSRSEIIQSIVRMNELMPFFTTDLNLFKNLRQTLRESYLIMEYIEVIMTMTYKEEERIGKWSSGDKKNYIGLRKCHSNIKEALDLFRKERKKKLNMNFSRELKRLHKLVKDEENI